MAVGLGLGLGLGLRLGLGLGLGLGLELGLRLGDDGVDLDALDVVLVVHGDALLDQATPPPLPQRLPAQGWG